MDSVINGPVAHWTTALLTFFGAPDWLLSLAVDGVVAGVGGVLVFVPGLLVLYFFLAVLEDSGYMARAAFVMDRFMRVVGLHGKSFIPMILGFGCAVPAIYATRTIASRRDRILTALLVPLMSCSARLPVYVVFGMAFFAAHAGTVIWLLYALGIIVALLAGLVFTHTLLKPNTSSAFVLELPPYRRPAFKGTLIHMWEHTSEFVRKAGTLIFALSIVMWVLLRLPLGVEDQQDSLFGRVSTAIAPVFAPLGFGDWETAGALVTGFVAKEVVVSTLSQIYVGEAESAEAEVPVSLGEDLTTIFGGFVTAVVDAGRIFLSLIPGVNLVPPDEAPQETALSLALQERFTPLTAVAFLVFVLLYVPCIATIGAIKHEFGTSWAVLSAVYQTSVAWLLAFLIFQGGRLIGLQ
jgi:ferrous iron transport protein B